MLYVRKRLHFFILLIWVREIFCVIQFWNKPCMQSLWEIFRFEVDFKLVFVIHTINLKSKIASCVRTIIPKGK